MTFDNCVQEFEKFAPEFNSYCEKHNLTPLELKRWLSPATYFNWERLPYFRPEEYKTTIISKSYNWIELKLTAEYNVKKETLTFRINTLSKLGFKGIKWHKTHTDFDKSYLSDACKMYLKIAHLLNQKTALLTKYISVLNRELDADLDFL